LLVFACTRRSFFTPGYVIAYLDRYGKIIPGSTAEVTEDYDPLLRPSEQGGILTNLVNPIFLTLSFMNCKNVETKAIPVSRQRVKRRRKQNQPGRIVFKTLKIDPIGKSRDSSGTGDGTKKAFHICAGHFKTYTDAAPLFGKIVGTFWWPHHVRGSKSRGEVRKDYELGEVKND
jgi:hypothetical protein